MKWMFCLLPIFFLFISCTKTEPGSPEPECRSEIDFGTILLTPDSRAFLPYNNSIDTMFFKNAEGEEFHFFRLSDLETNLLLHQIFAPCPNDASFETRQIFKRESFVLLFEGADEETRVFLNFQISALPSDDPKVLLIFDEFNMALFKKGVNPYSMQIITDFRGNKDRAQPLFLSPSFADSLELNGKFFYDVYSEFGLDTTRAIHYSPDVGLAGFRDELGQLWHFDRFN